MFYKLILVPIFRQLTKINTIPVKTIFYLLFTGTTSTNTIWLCHPIPIRHTFIYGTGWTLNPAGTLRGRKQTKSSKNSAGPLLFDVPFQPFQHQPEGHSPKKGLHPAHYPVAHKIFEQSSSDYPPKSANICPK